MKTNASAPRFVALAAITLAAVGFTGCTKQERADASAKAKEAYAESKAAVSKAWEDVKSYTFEKRDEFAAQGKALSAQMEAQASELRANFSEEKASASRKAAMAELKSAEADYKQKLAALGHASADTWESAKQNVIAAWDRLQAAYYKARAD